MTQSNSSSADSSASNTSFAKQGIEQEQSSTQDQDGKQVVGSGDNGHEGHHGPKGKGCGCGHTKGLTDHGGVNQSNASAADSSASNKSWAAQGVGQSQANRQLQDGLQRL